MAFIVTENIPLNMPVPGTREPAQIALLNENSVQLSLHDHTDGRALAVGRLRSGLQANRPAAGQAGNVYFSTDQGRFFVDTGTTWTEFLVAGRQGTVTGWTLIDPIIRDTIQWGPEGSSTIDVTLTRAAGNQMVLTLQGGVIRDVGRTPALGQAITEWRAAASTGSGRVGQPVNSTGIWVTSNADFDGTNWNRDDVARPALHLSLGTNDAADGALSVSLLQAKPAANPITTWISRMVMNNTGTFQFTPDSFGVGIDVLGAVSVQGNNIQVGPRGNNPSAGGRVIYWHDGGAMAWSTGMLAVGGQRDFYIYDFISGRAGLTIAASSGAAYFPAQVQAVQFRAMPASCEFSSYDRGVGLANNYSSFYRHDGISGIFDSTRGHDVFDCGPGGANFRLVNGGIFTFMVGNSGNVRLQNSAAGMNVEMNTGGGYWHPASDNTLTLGAPALRFVTIFAVSGAVNSSHISQKKNIAPLDPAACTQAVLDTQWWEFDYNDPPPPVRPEDMSDEDWTITEDAYQKMLLDTAGSRHSRGYVLGSPDHQTSELFGQRDRKSGQSTSDIAVVACALQSALQRIAELESKNAATA